MRLCAFGLSFILTFLTIAQVAESDMRILRTDADAHCALPTVVVDAGHGGADGGAVSSSGILEKDINLQIALRISAIYKTLGIPCVLTRDEDVMLNGDNTENKKLYDLRARVNVANNTKNCIFLSIHQNKFPQAQYKGLQVYYSKNNDASQSIAQNIQSGVQKYVQPDNNRQTKKATSSIYVLDNLHCPAVLVECGFLSNEEEASLLVSGEYQKKLSAVIAVSSLICPMTENGWEL